jgi:homoserine dehydrogenase
LQNAIRLGIIGLGTVGTGVARILQHGADQVAARAGGPLEIARVVVNDPTKKREVDIDPAVLGTDALEVIRDPDIPIIVELVGCPGGSVEPARTWLLEALRSGKHVVTANKDVVAKHGTELLRTAGEHGGSLYFEAAVAGGIPIIKAISEALVGNRIDMLMGIINGTTNYMLTKMTQEGAAFGDVLREAQARGYAEADPSSDVEGHDAAYKIAILASLAFETEIAVDAVYREGITRITPEDIRNAAELGYVVKLLAIAKRNGEHVEVRVHPTFIPQSHPLAAVNDAFNAVFVHGDAVGELMFYGRGAGMMPTASAVVADIVDAAHNLRRGVRGRHRINGRRTPILPISQSISRYYINTKVVDRPGVLAAITTAFGDNGVSLESVIQKGRGQDPVSLVFVTHEVQEANLTRALARIAQLAEVREVSNVVRVEGETHGRDY